MTKYEVILYWSAEDDAFIAEVPELAGCAADGATRQEALENVETVEPETGLASWASGGATEPLGMAPEPYLPRGAKGSTLAPWFRPFPG